MAIIKIFADRNYVSSAIDEIEIPEGLPVVTSENNGQFLRVIDGTWTPVALETEEWTFTLDDGTSVVKNVVVLA